MVRAGRRSVGLLWSWVGAILITLTLISGYVVARALLRGTGADEMRTRLTQIRGDLAELREIAEYPDAAPETQGRVHNLVEGFGLGRLLPPEQPGPGDSPSGADNETL